jgi:hypothetical protein
MFRTISRAIGLMFCFFMPCVFCVAQTPQPDAPMTAAALNSAEKKDMVQTLQPVIINGRPYVRPTAKQQFIAYLKDSYGLPAFAGAGVRSVYAQGVGKPDGWGQDWPGYGQRFGSALAVSAINGNVRYGMETLFREDMRYIPCHGCSVKKKVENALLAEITARHADDGHRYFTLTPTIADFSGPIIANTFWFPARYGPFDGVIASRLVFTTRIGGHLFREFVLERRHKDPKLDD